jgi:hypothetical protein
MAFHSLEPWGCEAEDYRAALPAAVTANVWRGKGAPVSPGDMVPDREGGGRVGRGKTDEELAEACRVALGG